MQKREPKLFQIIQQLPNPDNFNHFMIKGF